MPRFTVTLCLHPRCREKAYAGWTKKDQHPDYGYCLAHGVERWHKRFVARGAKEVAKRLMRAGAFVAMRRAKEKENDQ